MVTLTSRISTASDLFRANRRDMLALLDDVRSVESKIEALSDLRRPQFKNAGNCIRVTVSCSAR